MGTKKDINQITLKQENIFNSSDNISPVLPDIKLRPVIKIYRIDLNVNLLFLCLTFLSL